MNEFIAKKVGEVAAFALVGNETFERGQQALSGALGEENFAAYQKLCRAHLELLERLSAREGVTEVVERKIAGTGGKLRQMRDLYIGEEWDNATELFEWLSFFEGAAIAHWQLVRGASEALGIGELAQAASTAVASHTDFYNTINDRLYRIGAERAAR